MTKIFANKILTSSGWKENITVEVNADGHIEKLGTDTKEYDHHVGCLLPAPVNAHSHSFQRAMSGLTEYRGPNPKDSFWTWRKLMFKFLKKLDPDIVEAITAFVQMEMLEAGFSTNVEFHYLHHSESGKPYDDISEMSQRIISAADQSGIGLTLLPVFYQYGGCDLRALEDGQIRFGNNLDQFQTLFQRVSKILETSSPNTSSISITQIASSTKRPNKVG